jgi:tetratricopeptide (TPR) repeat protein
MLARSTNLQKEFQMGLFLAEALLLIVAVFVIVRAITASTPAPLPQQSSQIILTSNTDETLFVRAQDRLKEGDIEGSLTLLDAVLELAAAPTSDMFATRALAFSRLQMYPQAVQDYQEAIALDPNNAMYQTGLCFTSAQMRDFNTAMPSCDNAITLQPDNWVVWNDRCYLRAYYTGAYQGAISDCTQSLALNPGHPYPYNNRARAYLLSGNYTEAIADASRSIDLGNRYPALPYTTRGTAYIALGNFAQGLAEYQTALSIDPTYPELHLRMGELYRYQNQTEQARQSYCRYIENDSYPIQYAIDLAQSYGGCG